MNKLIGMWDGYGFMGYKGSSRYYAFDLALACSAYRALKKVEPDRVKEHDKVMEDKVLITFNVWDEFKARSIECKALNVNGNVVSVDNIKVIDNNYTCTIPLSLIQLDKILNKSNKEICNELFIELSTLKTHINKIYKRNNKSFLVHIQTIPYLWKQICPALSFYKLLQNSSAIENC